MATLRLAIIVGAGEGIGASTARRFARDGFSVALLSRTPKTDLAAELAALAPSTRPLALAADAADEAAMATAFAEIAAATDGATPEVLVYNAAHFKRGTVAELALADVVDGWRSLCLGAFVSVQAVLPAMLTAGRGSILLTGATASTRGGAGFSCLAIGKAGLRLMGQSLAREVGPAGIHVAHVVVDGFVDTPAVRRMTGRAAGDAGLIDPAAVADTFAALHAQPRSAWTQELDVRPSSEKW